MYKTFKTILALAIGAVAMTFAACSSDGDAVKVPSQQEIESKIIGKWKTVHRDGEDVLTNKRDVFSFSDKTNGCFSSSQSFPDHGNIWYNKFPYTYSISNNELLITIDSDIIKEIFGRITDINNECFNITMGDKSNNSLHTSKVIYNRMTADYSQDIIGMWEGVEMTGYETYGNAEARIEYRADGTYTYYKKVDGDWVPSANVDNEYNVDGDWLATRWRSEAGKDYNYEWWDIDYIKDGMMKWSALREKEDGTRFTTTFTWKKVM